jgi:hypothetical protein
MVRSGLFWVWCVCLVLFLVPVRIEVGPVRAREPLPSSAPFRAALVSGPLDDRQVGADPWLRTLPETESIRLPAEPIMPPARPVERADRRAMSMAAGFGSMGLAMFGGAADPPGIFSAGRGARMMVEAPRASLRSGPSAAAPELAVLTYGSEVAVLTRASEGWLKVRCPETGAEGYVAEAFLGSTLGSGG